MEYKFPVYKLLGFIAVYLFLGLFPYGLLMDSFEEGSAAYMLFSMAIAGLYMYFLVLGVMESMTKVEISNEAIHIKKPLKTLSYKWEDIIEFGKFWRVASHAQRWIYYIKTNKSGDEKIIIGNYQYEGIDEMIKNIYRRAYLAKFVIQERASIVPFSSKTNPVKWDINKEL